MSDMDDFTHIPGWELDKGQKRENNEDSLGAVKINKSNASDKRSLGIYVVADGVGGEAGGEKASKLAVEMVLDEMLTHLNEDASAEVIKEQLSLAASKAHKHILKLKAARENVGGTTLVMAAIMDNHVYIANIGDSRAYILHDDNLRQITADHTVAQKFVEAGIITPEEAETHPMSHVLLHAVGSEEEEDVSPDIFTETVSTGDFVLLCTDGLYNSVPPKTIVRIINNADTPTSASQQLTQAANDAGGPDNIAVVLVEIRQRSTLD